MNEELTDDQLIDKLLNEVTFERQFYESIAETEDYDVIPVDAHYMTPSYGRDTLERQALETQCERSGLKVLYRISYGTYAVILCKADEDNPSKGRIGIIPESNPDGWPC